MLDQQTNDDELTVPTGARLLHAGMPKTGTTALQRTAASRRDLLLGHGVRYPGTGTTNHRKAMFAYSARPVGWAEPGGSVPDRTHWVRLPYLPVSSCCSTAATSAGISASWQASLDPQGSPVAVPPKRTSTARRDGLEFTLSAIFV